MGTFAYIARNPDGQRVTGKLSGATEHAVLAELSSRSLAPVEVTEVREKAGFGRRIPARHLATMYGQLADLLRAGVPLLRALRLLGRTKSNPKLAKVMSNIAEAVSEGERLADAMAARDGVFPDVQIAMVRAGEQGGFMEQVFERLSNFLEHQANMRGRLLGSLIYPLLLLFVAAMVVLGALIFLVPRFESIFDNMDIGWSTRLLMGASLLVTDHGVALVIVIAIIIVAGMWVFRQGAVRRTLRDWQLRIVVVGPLTRALAVARFTRILGTLLGNGIPMLTAMHISRDAAGHPRRAAAIDEATESVRGGESLAGPLRESGFFTDDIVEMIAVGEAANNLPDVLVTIADAIEKRVDRMLALALRLLEPLLLMVLAGVVLFIFIALALPMMQMSTALAG